MCNCSNEDFWVREGKLWGEYDGDFHAYPSESYSFCPICGENLQPERSKRKDYDLVYVDENGKKIPVYDPFDPRRCVALNTDESQ